MYYSYVEIDYVATSFSPARMDFALKLLKAAVCTPFFQQYTVPHVCRKWGIPFSLVKARTEIWKFYFGRILYPRSFDKLCYWVQKTRRVAKVRGVWEFT